MPQLSTLVPTLRSRACILHKTTKRVGTGAGPQLRRLQCDVNWRLSEQMFYLGKAEIAVQDAGIVKFRYD